MQGQGFRSRGEVRWGWQEASWASGGWASEGWVSEALASEAGPWRGVGRLPLPWPVAGDGAPRREVSGEVVKFQRY